jgi:AcrR family transcriptional regulator
MTISVDRAKARRERVQALAREDILEAALGAFAKNGYGDTKIADIAAAAGYTAASLYTYFPGKKEIFIAAADHFVSGVEQAFGRIPSEPPADFEALATDVRARIRGLCAYGDQRSDVLAFFMRLRWSGEPVLQEIRPKGAPCAGLGGGGGDGGATSDEDREHGPFRLHAYFGRVWKALGVERFGVDPVAIAGVVSATIESFFVRKYIFRLGGTLLEDADRIADLLLYGMRGAR